MNIGFVGWSHPAISTVRPYIRIQDHKTSGTNGGTFTSGAWRTRDLNTEVEDTHGLASIASNQITLAPGTYKATIRCPAIGVAQHVARLQNVSDGTTLLPGSNAYSISSGAFVQSDSIIVGRFSLIETRVLEVQHQCGTTRATDGFGVPTSLGTEIYTVVELEKEG